MSEAKNAEAELAKVLFKSGYATPPTASKIAAILIDAGYAKRSDTLEEAAKVADVLRETPAGPTRNPLVQAQYDATNETCTFLARRIRSLKGRS